MLQHHDQYQIDDDRQRFNPAIVQQWMATTYWWRDSATLLAVQRACENSALLVGVYLDQQQVGCCRVISDKVRFAWLADVFIDPAHRRRGLARAMVRFVVDHPELATIARFMLATPDAHHLYAQLGFAPPPDPQWLMQRNL